MFIRKAALALLLLFLAACGAVDPDGGPAVVEKLPATPPHPAPADPTTAVRLVKIVGGLRRPAYLTHAGDPSTGSGQDERLFVVEQWGKIRVVQDGHLLEEPFLDLTERISTDGSERGLLGLAFHPRYSENGRFFVVFTDPAGDTVIAEYAVDPDDPNRADPASEQVILYIEQPYGNHNGGQLLFGPDGFFYVGLGDGGAVGDPFDNAQDPGTVLGAVLRLDVDGERPYAIPPDNPFVGQSGAQGEVWAVGLRNPWAFSFDRLTGDFYLADVGQEGPEEINFLPAGHLGGANFGWPVVEGRRCYRDESCDPDGFRPPVLTYEHGRTCAIIGGYVYRGRQFPSLAGNYFFSDYCAGTIWSLVYDEEDGWRRTAVFETESQVSSLGEGADGELYVVEYKPRDGAIYQIQPVD